MGMGTGAGVRGAAGAGVSGGLLGPAAKASPPKPIGSPMTKESAAGAGASGVGVEEDCAIPPAPEGWLSAACRAISAWSAGGWRGEMAARSWVDGALAAGAEAAPAPLGDWAVAAAGTTCVGSCSDRTAFDRSKLDAGWAGPTGERVPEDGCADPPLR
jgi:hypothetical protein